MGAPALMSPSALAAAGLPSRSANDGVNAKAKAAAQDFESVFLQTMVGQMFSGLGEEGPLGEGEAGSAWRGLLVQEYAANISKSGGIGIADSVYREILSLQEAKPGLAG